MKKLKEFLKQKKINNEFKHLGEGYSLNTNPSQPSTNSPAGGAHSSQSASDPASDDLVAKRLRAAEAIAKRMNSGPKISAAQKKLQLQVKMEIEKENQALKEAQECQKKFEAPKSTLENDSCNNMLYTCDLLEKVVLTKSELYKELESFLIAQLEEEPLDASVLLIYSLNTPEKVAGAKSCLEAYIKNILFEPTNPKFLRIRLLNKLFEEKVKSVKGAVEFLKAIGFVEKTEFNETAKQDEQFLILTNPNLDLIREAAKELSEGNPIYLRIYRDPKILKVDPSIPIPSPEISPDFYKLSVGEIQAEQKAQTEQVEKLLTLRTRKMREADAGPRKEYKYTLIRVRFPNNFILQGIFNVNENVFAVREFIEKHLEVSLGAFDLTMPCSNIKKYSEDKTLLDYGFVPTALFYFQWENDVLTQYNGDQLTYLSKLDESKASALL